MAFKKLTKEQDALVELIASFSAIAGETFSTNTSDGRMYSWHCDETDTFWLNIVVDDSGVSNVLLHSGDDDTKFYAAIGYCKYHNIPLEIQE